MTFIPESLHPRVDVRILWSTASISRIGHNIKVRQHQALPHVPDVTQSEFYMVYFWSGRARLMDSLSVRLIYGLFFLHLPGVAWLPDTASDSCMACDAVFTLMRLMFCWSVSMDVPTNKIMFSAWNWGSVKPRHSFCIFLCPCMTLPNW